MISKQEVLNITNEYYISYYCKNDICKFLDYNYSKSIINFPDEDGNLNEYIIDTCTYDSIESNTCNVLKQCNKDKECFYNKCFKNYCMFNNNNNITHCDDIYISPSLFKDRSSYMYCG